MNRTSNHRLLLLTVFICGFVVMAFEIIGSRVLAPFLGTSTFVWVSIIGIILFAMSGGYYFGGQQADRGPSLGKLSRFILLASIAICLMNLAKNQWLMAVDQLGLPLLANAIISSLVLFTVPGFFLAAVFPYALKLSISTIEDTGSVAGKLYATSTIGSIAGTFASAVVLIPAFGTTNILWILAAILLSVALIIKRHEHNRLKALTVLLIGLNIGFANYPRPYLDIDSWYNRIWIIDASAQDRPTRYLALNGHVNSGMWVDNPIEEQLYPYSDYFRLANHFNQSSSQSLMLGAGGYTFPKLHQHLWPEKALDIVEIDPKLTALSKIHFSFEEGENTRIFHEDARTFLLDATKKYDIIYSDVFTSPLDVPFQMTTKECYHLQYDALNENGVLILNVLGNWEGKFDRFLLAQMKTAASVFDQVLLFEVEDGRNSNMNNNMLVALKSDRAPVLQSPNEEIQAMLEMKRTPDFSKAMVLCDDFAPANWLLRGQ